MANKDLSFDIANKAKSGSINLSGKMLGAAFSGAEKAWVVSGAGGGILLLPFDAQVGPMEQVERFLAEAGVAPTPLSAETDDEPAE